MRQEERQNDTEETLRLAMDGRQAQIHTNQPGIIVSFDPVKQTAVVQPAIQARVRLPDGTHVFRKLPLVLDVPVAFPGGGGATMTFPIKAGDECLLSHTHRDLSAWWQQGGVQPPLELRMHDLSDAVCQVGIRSQARRIHGGVSTQHAQFRSDTGDVNIELDNSANVVRVHAAGAVEINAPVTRISGKLEVMGDITLLNGSIDVGTHTHPDPQGGHTGAPDRT